MPLSFPCVCSIAASVAHHHSPNNRGGPYARVFVAVHGPVQVDHPEPEGEAGAAAHGIHLGRLRQAHRVYLPHAQRPPVRLFAFCVCMCVYIGSERLWDTKHTVHPTTPPSTYPPPHHQQQKKTQTSIASVIEYFLEKFMCVMHLKLELDAAEAAADPPTDATTAAATPGSSGSGGGKQQQGQDGHGPASYRRGSSRSLEGEGEGEDGEGEEGNKWASDGEEGDENDERQAEFFGGGGGGRSGSGEDAAGGAFTDPFDAGRHGAGWRADSGDLLLGRGGSSDPIPPSSPPPPEPCASPPPAPSHYVQRGIDGGAKAKMGAWGAALAASGQGVLFESEGVLRVLCRQEFRGHQGHLQLLYTNLGAAPLEGFHATASSNTAGARGGLGVFEGCALSTCLPGPKLITPPPTLMPCHAPSHAHQAYSSRRTPRRPRAWRRRSRRPRPSACSAWRSVPIHDIYTPVCLVRLDNVECCCNHHRPHHHYHHSPSTPSAPPRGSTP